MTKTNNNMEKIVPPQIESRIRKNEVYQRADIIMGILPEKRDRSVDGVWRDFFALTGIPRASGHEEQVGEFLELVGKEKALTPEKDTVGNVLWRIPASSPELATPEKSTLIQVHQDMVSKGHPDPAEFGVEPEIVESDGSWFVQAKQNQSTLGADDGIMVALAMQLPELLTDIPHGEIGVLFTVDEERGLNGAKAVNFDLSHYGNYLNLDSEEDHEITIGSAAVGDTYIHLPIRRIPLPEDRQTVCISLSGLRGGHSGVKIGDPTRENAIKVLTNTATTIEQQGVTLNLVDVKVDGPMNAIPDEGTITMSVTDKEKVQEVVDTIAQDIKKNEPHAILALSDATADSMLDDLSSQRVLSLPSSLPHGVQEREDYDTTLVKTSTNLAQITLSENATTVGMMSRSSDNQALQTLREQKIAGIAEQAGATVKQDEASPAWEPIVNGDLAVLISRIHKELFGTPMRQVTTHGGLETSHILPKYPQFLGHIASIGANVFHAHEILENTEGPSVERTAQLVLKTIEALAKPQEESIRRHAA